MSTSAVSTSSLHQQIQQYFHTRQTDLHELGQALGTGDLAGAQTAFQAITQLGQSGPFASGDPFANSRREQDFTNIGQALQSGNLAGAQQAFSALKATLQKNNGSQPAPIADPILTAAPVQRRPRNYSQPQQQQRQCQPRTDHHQHQPNQRWRRASLS